MKDSKGFTLVELLVVVAIIALLLAIIMPALNKAKMQAQRILCLNNVHQQTIVQHTYASASSRGKFPSHADWQPYYLRDPGTYAGVSNTVRDCYDSYVSNGKMFVCPSVALLAKQTPQLVDSTGSHRWGYFFTSKWYLKRDGPTNDCGGWDGKRPNGQFPHYVLTSFNWYANYSVPNSTVNFEPFPGQFPKEPRWPVQLSDCSSRNVMISHSVIGTGDPGSPYTGRFSDWTHGGSLTVSPTDIRKFKGKDTDLGFGDGHAEYVQKKTFRKRVTFTSLQNPDGVSMVY